MAQSAGGVGGAVLDEPIPHLLKASDIQVMQWDDAGGYSYNLKPF